MASHRLFVFVARTWLGLAVLLQFLAVARAQTTATTSTTATTVTTVVTSTTPIAGVLVDPNGVLRTQIYMDQTGQLMWQRVAAAKAQLNPKLAKASPMRKISLTRLDAVLREKLAAGEKPTDEMKNLAGMTRVQYVFYYPDTKDIVIAGPAEGWAADLSGRVRGLSTGKPVVQLDDLVTALRAFPPGGKNDTPVISCSIDPTKEGLQRMQDFLKQTGSRLSAASAQSQTQEIVSGLKESLGLQTVRITGVPATTHFAQVLVEADYRMKLIGIGLERPPVKQLASYVDRANPRMVSRNALQRWYFVPDYECVRETVDGLAMEMVGNGVKLVNSDEIVSSDGSRVQSSAIDAASRAFTEAFTKKYAELASVIPVYSQLRNCIDLAVVAAFIQEKDYYGKADWKMPFGDEETYAVKTLTAPQQVESAVTSVFKGSTLMTPIGGGVHIEPRMALKESNLLRDDDGKVGKVREDVDLKNLHKDQWWWD